MRILSVLLFSAVFIYAPVSSKPVTNGKSFSDSHSTSLQQCGNNDEMFDQDDYRPHPRFEIAEKLPSHNFDYDHQKRASFHDDDVVKKEQKRQVGVVYREDKPIGILQPYQRSYRFIPVNDETSYNPNNAVQDLVPFQQNIIDKRSIDDTYPSILTNFRIDSKLDEKRSEAEKSVDKLSFDEDSMADLKSTDRRMRSSSPEQIDVELKSILNDMGLIKDEQKRDDSKDVDSSLLDDNVPVEREKRDDGYKSPKILSSVANAKGLLTAEERRNEIGDDSDNDVRTKREKSSPVRDDDEESKRVIEREIQEKIEHLKEEVKREIRQLNEKKKEMRRKRATLDNDETDDLDPVKHPENEMKTLIRKRRNADESYEDLSKKKRDENDEDNANQRTKRNQHDDDDDDIRKKRSQFDNNKLEESEDGSLGDLLEFEEKSVKKDPCNGDDSKNRIRRHNEEESMYANDDYDDEEREKREDFQYDSGTAVVDDADDEFNEMKPRVRRRIVEETVGEKLDRPQQLSDMSDNDLFGALPKGFDGELSRYKRVRK